MAARTFVAEREGEALLDINRALVIDPDLGIAHVALARIHAYNWRSSEAREAFEQAMQSSPNDPRTMSDYASFMSRSGAHSDAINMYLRVMELDPERSHYGIAEAYDQAGDLDAAAAAYRSAIEKSPGQPISPPQLALVELRRGNLAEAEALLPRAEQVLDRWAASSGNLLPQLAYIYARLGRPDEVERILNKFEEHAAERTASAATLAGRQPGSRRRGASPGVAQKGRRKTTV